MSQAVALEASRGTEIHAARLFRGSCVALISSAVMFAIFSDIIGPLKQRFILSNLEVGYIGGALSWGFMLSIIVLGPLCDALGMRALLMFAFACHTAGVLIMIFAGGFWMLFWGALINALGSGTVEAVCNP